MHKVNWTVWCHWWGELYGASTYKLGQFAPKTKSYMRFCCKRRCKHFDDTERLLTTLQTIWRRCKPFDDSATYLTTLQVLWRLCKLFDEVVLTALQAVWWHCKPFDDAASPCRRCKWHKYPYVKQQTSLKARKLVKAMVKLVWRVPTKWW